MFQSLSPPSKLSEISIPPVGYGFVAPPKSALGFGLISAAIIMGIVTMQVITYSSRSFTRAIYLDTITGFRDNIISTPLTQYMLLMVPNVGL
ncbi:hypothetical protein DL93DRAFT_1229965 [Clavulina sp. PMI_390]|nr:hypothetical protein DL93DRAFT_1229965 [Clavulina sp. PMI_390]